MRNSDDLNLTEKTWIYNKSVLSTTVRKVFLGSQRFLALEDLLLGLTHIWWGAVAELVEINKQTL